ncbi:probable plastid-lipid-associated protein 12, chloroplastic isoform X2 [Phalaenopsis equestris]|uniref:probable plastid-lipid-associated protein 12, chloroplastic isoform X2 n=1 Tax=Phalaenopsis equestris TaxID=78828 RepID=UPI0009E26D6C|nr:probable plastid-lipid-associated protein 12, chloroplastic isoform X2 [Phalaenopsis equestris]
MAVGAARPGFPPLISWRWTTSAPTVRPLSSKYLGRRPQLHGVFASLVEEREISFTEPESALVDALIGIQGRGRSASPQQLKEVERAVETLENLKGIPDPTKSNLIEGLWQLMFTTRPGTASPIQKTFVGVNTFKIFQEVYLRGDDPRVINIVQFSDQIGELKVEAAASVKDGKRILFQFDRAAFSFKILPCKIPYPVPFRLLGDEAKGWLDTTYLSTSGIIRISRGSKGTTFVLQKKPEPRQKLLLAVTSGESIADVIDEVVSLRRNKLAADLDDLEGEWQLLWSSQIVKKNGNLENSVTPFSGFKLHANGSIVKSDANQFKATINGGAYLAGSMKFPFDIKTSYSMELLYIDDKIRITRQNEDIMLIHLRISNK